MAQYGQERARMYVPKDFPPVFSVVSQYICRSAVLSTDFYEGKQRLSRVQRAIDCETTVTERQRL
jgi:hypothetical protein